MLWRIEHGSHLILISPFPWFPLERSPLTSLSTIFPDCVEGLTEDELIATSQRNFVLIFRASRLSVCAQVTNWDLSISWDLLFTYSLSFCQFVECLFFSSWSSIHRSCEISRDQHWVTCVKYALLKEAGVGLTLRKGWLIFYQQLLHKLWLSTHFLLSLEILENFIRLALLKLCHREPSRSPHWS